MSTTLDLPEQGQMVSVRSRHWMVTEVATTIYIFHLENDRELAEITECKTNQLCNPPAREAELLIEQNALEFELGQDYFR